MTEQSFAADGGSPPPEAVRRSLRSLADDSRADGSRAACDGDSPDHAASTSVNPERTVREAEVAVSCAAAAADFLAAGRLPELDAAIAAAADRRGAAALAARGRDARRTLLRLRAALLGDGEEAAVEPVPDSDLNTGASDTAAS